MNLKKVLYIPDCHFPNVDIKSYNLMLSVASDFKPHEIVILGDYQDVFCLSRYDKDPLKNFNLLSEELKPGIDALDALERKFKSSKITYLGGNHERRITTYFSVYASKLGDIFKERDVLKIPKNIKYISYSKTQKYVIGKLIAKHGSICGKYPASKNVERMMHSVIHGHTHNVQEFHSRNSKGEDLIGISSGWLGSDDHADYVTEEPPWTKAFTLAIFKPNGTFYHQIIQIHENELIFNGEIYK